MKTVEKMAEKSWRYAYTITHISLTILRGTRNLILVSIRFRLFDEKRKKNNLIKFDEFDFETKEANEKPI